MDIFDTWANCDLLSYIKMVERFVFSTRIRSLVSESMGKARTSLKGVRVRITFYKYPLLTDLGSAVTIYAMNTVI